MKIETYIKGYEAAAPGRTLSVFSADEQYELAKLALQSLSQEAVRDEVLEEAAKVCDKHADDWLPHHIPEKGTSKNPIYWQQRHEAAERCAELIRALKREPNAARTGASDD